MFRVALCLTSLATTRSASWRESTDLSLPAAVVHAPTPYTFVPDATPPDSSKPMGDGVDEAFANRVRNRKAEDILKQEIEEKFITIYGETVSLDAKCTAYDPGDSKWTDPLPVPFNASTADRIALEDHTLRDIVRDAVAQRKRRDSTDALPSEVIEGVGVVHDAPTSGQETNLDWQTHIDLDAESSPHGESTSPTKMDGVEFGAKIETNLSNVVEEQQNKAREIDAGNVLNVVEME